MRLAGQRGECLGDLLQACTDVGRCLPATSVRLGVRGVRAGISRTPAAIDTAEAHCRLRGFFLAADSTSSATGTYTVSARSLDGCGLGSEPIGRHSIIACTKSPGHPEAPTDRRHSVRPHFGGSVPTQSGCDRSPPPPRGLCQAVSGHQRSGTWIAPGAPSERPGRTGSGGPLSHCPLATLPGPALSSQRARTLSSRLVGGSMIRRTAKLAPCRGPKTEERR